MPNDSAVIRPAPMPLLIRMVSTERQRVSLNDGHGALAGSDQAEADKVEVIELLSITR